MLLVLVKGFGRLPDGVSNVFARVLESATGPFHVVNYLGSKAGPFVFGGADKTAAELDRVIASLHRRLDSESEETLRLRMHFPASWDPFFNDSMSVGELYRYATQHFDFHRRQLTLDRSG
ncbi:MAG: DinB family protein [Nocardioidaceae bacterium]